MQASLLPKASSADQQEEKVLLWARTHLASSFQRLMLPASLGQSSRKPLLKGLLKFVSEWMIYVVNLCMLSRLVNNQHLLASFFVHFPVRNTSKIPTLEEVFAFPVPSWLPTNCSVITQLFPSVIMFAVSSVLFWLLYTVFLHSTQSLASQGFLGLKSGACKLKHRRPDSQSVVAYRTGRRNFYLCLFFPYFEAG